MNKINISQKHIKVGVRTFLITLFALLCAAVLVEPKVWQQRTAGLTGAEVVKVEKSIHLEKGMTKLSEKDFAAQKYQITYIGPQADNKHNLILWGTGNNEYADYTVIHAGYWEKIAHVYEEDGWIVVYRQSDGIMLLLTIMLIAAFLGVLFGYVTWLNA